jgi:hypothetical protein
LMEVGIGWSNLVGVIAVLVVLLGVRASGLSNQKAAFRLWVYPLVNKHRPWKSPIFNGN